MLGSELMMVRLGGEGFRVVEFQSKVATMGLVDTLEDQKLLEDMLERTKTGTIAATRHYLLTTPFRYPPLRNASRYGVKHQRGMFYGAEQIETALAESAFYAFLFARHSPDMGDVNSDRTSFRFAYETERGLDTTTANFDHLRTALNDPGDYSTCQEVGLAAREAGVEVVRFRSVRCPGGGANLAILDASVFTDGPTDETRWRMRLANGRVDFLEVNSNVARRLTFTAHDFAKRGVFSHPDG